MFTQHEAILTHYQRLTGSHILHRYQNGVVLKATFWWIFFDHRNITPFPRKFVGGSAQEMSVLVVQRQGGIQQLY